jgi:S-phase kinase-associated protein 1
MVKCQLQCKTGRIFVVEIEDLRKATVIKMMLDDLKIGHDPSVEVDDDVIPLPNLTEQCMEKLLEWCKKHKDDVDPPESEDFNFKDEIDDWDLQFLKMDDGTLFDLILAANYLDIKGLLDITTTYVARLITDLKTPEDIRKRFNIKNDLTPEDLEQIKEESKTWLNDDQEEKTAPGEPTPSSSGASASGGAGSSEMEGAVGGAEGGSN